MKHIFKSVILVFILTTFSCEKTVKKKQTAKFNQEKSSISVYLNNYSGYPVAISKNTSYNYLGADLKVSKDSMDTLLINVDSYEYFYVSHKNTLGDTILLGGGDILNLVIYKDSIKYTILDSESKSQKYFSIGNKIKSDVEYLRLKKSIDSLTSIFYSLDFNGRPMVGNNDYQKFINYPVKVNRESLNRKVKEKGLLLEHMKLFYDYQIYYNDLITGVPSNIVQLWKYDAQISFYNSLSIFQRRSNSEVARKTLDSDIFINEYLLDNPYAKSILFNYMSRTVIKGKPEYSRSTQYIDYREAFDSVPNHLNDSLSKFARFLSIEAMVNFGESFKNVKSKFQQFEGTYRDKRLNAVLERKYLFHLNKFDSITNDVKLVDKANRVNSFKSKLESFKGQLVYIDFWASWCAPCREVMPDSKDLIKEFKDEEIIFLYLSIDKNMDAWLGASKAEEIHNYAHSYKILNMENADFLKQLDIKVIPRYVLIDKNGKITYENAPGPKGTSIRELLKVSLN